MNVSVRRALAALVMAVTAALMHALAEDPAVLPPALRAQRASLPFVEVSAFLARHAVPGQQSFACPRVVFRVPVVRACARYLVELAPVLCQPSVFT